MAKRGQSRERLSYTVSPWVYERKFVHTLKAEKVLGRKLKEGECVHHVDGGNDNSNDNLVVCPSHSYHMLIHARQRAMDACGDPNKRKCCHCKEYDDINNMKQVAIKGKNEPRNYHSACDNAKRRIRNLKHSLKEST